MFDVDFSLLPNLFLAGNNIILKSIPEHYFLKNILGAASLTSAHTVLFH